MDILENSQNMESGAGGSWKRYEETTDETIVKQTTGISCVSAVGEMLLKTRGISVSQEKIRAIIGEPTYIANLARCLNTFDKDTDDGKEWQGFTADVECIDAVLSQKPISVILLEPMSFLGHAVIIENVSEDDFIEIKDPFDQTSYKMTFEDFKQHWGGEVILRWFIKE
ncbi:MAG TPA: cysteine peptidase family C39 domain-containing protein [Pyrinomonadaceae bacterium]